MGEVWEAHDSRLDRVVAIKLIPQRLSSDPSARRRFVHEAQAASSIEHANICTIHEIDETPEGETFIVMPRYQGELLSHRVARGRLPFSEALQIVENLAGALADAHDHDIVHRDVKPANVIIDPHGRPVLLDFGLAKLSEHSRVTKTGVTVGTVDYISPEQASGGDVDGRADLFSLGVVLYELVTGVRPFAADHEAAVLYRITNQAAAPLASHDASLPAALQTIIDRALAKDPKDRYADLHEFQLVIGDLRNEASSSSGRRRDVPPRPRPRWMVPALVGLLIVSALMLWKFVPLPGGGVEAGEHAIAVVEFHDLTGTDESHRALGMAGLVQVGMVENGPCRVVSPSYLQDIRRRLFGVERGPIDESQALEVARASGATVLLSGQMGELDGDGYVAWQLVDTETGESIAAKRAQGEQMWMLADAVITGVLPALAQHCGGELTPAPQSVASMTTENPRAHEYYIAGKVAMARHDMDGAVRLFENAVEQDSTFALAYLEMAWAYRADLVYGEARESIEHAWRWRSRLSIRDRMRLEAWREQMRQRAVAAIEILREVHARWPDDRQVLNDLSYLLYFQWFTPEAIEVTRRAKELYPDDASFALRYEAALGSQGRAQESLEGARHLVARFPENPNHWDELALRYIGVGEADSAEAAFRQALQREPGFVASEQGLAALPYYRGDLDGALDAYTRLAQAPERTPVQEYRLYMGMQLPVGKAWILREAGRYAELFELIDDAGELRTDPVDRFYHQRYRCMFLLNVGRAEEVLRWVDNVAVPLAAGSGAAADNPHLRGVARSAVLNFRAFALVGLDSLEAARSAAISLSESATEFGNHWRLQALRVRAQIAIKERDSATALAALDEVAEQATSVGRGYIGYMEMRAQAYRMAGRLDEATAVHEELLNVYSGHALSHYKLGRLHEERHRPDDAAVEYRRFLEMWAGADEGLPQLMNARARLAAL